MNVSTMKGETTLMGQDGSVRSVAFSGDGARLATASEAGVWLWDAGSASEVRRWPHAGSVVALAFSRDGAHLGAGLASGGSILAWPLDGTADAPSASMKVPDLPATSAVTFTRDRYELLSGSADGLLRLWDAISHRQIAALPGHDGAIQAIALSPDGKRIATGGMDRTVRIWNADTHELLLILRVTAPVQSLAFGPDSDRLAAGLVGGVVRVWHAPRADR
jgi:WD40 repeat protein